jgi:hypothetical protein
MRIWSVSCRCSVCDVPLLGELLLCCAPCALCCVLREEGIDYEAPTMVYIVPPRFTI